MKHNYRLILPFAFVGLALIQSKSLIGGNPDRVGQEGATELLINPWARSSGWAGSNVAGTQGLESMFTNVAGTAFTKKTELIFTHDQYLKGSDININAFGLTQHVGETGAIGLAIMSMHFGDIPITTSESPEGGLGTYTPQFINMQYSGDGLSFKTPVPASTSTQTMTVDQRAAQFELPSLLNIGAGYDFYLKKDSALYKTHRITVMANFVDNSFDKDQFLIGLEYGWKNMLMLRAGYSYEQGITSLATRTTVYTGPSAGFTVEIPFGKNKSTFGIDYSYRATNPFEGTHTIGARINL